TAPPYISSTCWKLTRIICSKGNRCSEGDAAVTGLAVVSVIETPRALFVLSVAVIDARVWPARMIGRTVLIVVHRVATSCGEVIITMYVVLLYAHYKKAALG